MNSTFEEFIKILKQKTPEGTNTVDILTNITPMSKEAAYRRLRGEIDFSFSEIIKIAQKLDISLDNLIKTEGRMTYSVKVIPIKEESFMENYINWAESTHKTMKELRSITGYYILAVNNNTPVSYLFNYELISKLRTFKWMYQRNTHSKPIRMSEFQIPAKAVSLEKMIMKELRQTKVHFIYGQELMRSLVNDINYFQHLDLISKEEVKQMKQEAFSLLEDMEHDAIMGKNLEAPSTMHVTNINFDNDFILWHCEKFTKITFRLFGINHYSIDNQEAIDEMTNWTNMLLKSSTQISFSGEKKRMEFFQHQRNLLGLL